MKNQLAHLITEARFKEITNALSKLKPLVVVGDVGIDKYTLGEVTRISPEAPVPVVKVSKEWEKLGLAANIGHNLSSLGIESTLCGVIGQDIRAPRFDSLLETENLKTWGIVRDATRPTIFKERITTNTQQICRIDYEDTLPLNDDVATQVHDRIADFLESHSGIIIEDYSKGTMTEKLIKDCISLAKDRKKPIFVDPGTHTPPTYYKGADLLKPNLKEAKIMVESLGYTYDKKSIEEMAAILVDKLDLNQIVITLGPEGMALFDRNKEKSFQVIPTVAQEVFDVSGAGDTTISLLASSLLAGATLSEAAWLGNCGAGVVVAKKGTATVNLEELTIFYKRLVERFS